MIPSNRFYLIIIIRLNTVIVFQVFLFNLNNLQNRSIRHLDGTLTDTTTPGQSGPRNNSNEAYSTLIYLDLQD